MERHVKERLVGAAVLMAAAIVIIPEMVSDAPPENRPQPAQAAGETPVKTYTIDLSQAPGAKAGRSEPIPDTRAPPAEMPAPEPAATPQVTTELQQDSEIVAQAEAEKPAAPPPVTPTLEAVTPPVPRPDVAPAPVESKPPAALVSAPPVPKSSLKSGWAVQLGSFASQATAQRLVTELRSMDESAFVMPVKSGAGTLYRVRVGPLASKPAAEEVLRKVKPKYSGAVVVAHP